MFCSITGQACVQTVAIHLSPLDPRLTGANACHGEGDFN